MAVGGAVKQATDYQGVIIAMVDQSLSLSQPQPSFDLKTCGVAYIDIVKIVERKKLGQAGMNPGLQDSKSAALRNLRITHLQITQ